MATIHEQIRTARKNMGWSMEKLAQEVSDAEGLAKPLTWQTVQQWEDGKSAPKRTRMELVKRLLKIEPAGVTPPALQDPEMAELAHKYYDILIALEYIREDKLTGIRKLILDAAQDARATAAHVKAREEKQRDTAHARGGGTGKSSTSMSYGDGNRRQRSLPLTTVPDPFTAEPSEREAALYHRIERSPKEPHGGGANEPAGKLKR